MARTILNIGGLMQPSMLLIYLVVTCAAVAEIAPIDPEAGPIVAAGLGEKGHVAVPADKTPGHEMIHDGSAPKSEAAEAGSATVGYMGASGSFAHGFIATLSVIIVSELGDKTFFIAAIMAMRHARWTVFTAAMAALSIMHVMSSFFGYAITIIPRIYTFYISSFLFAIFGLKMLREGWKMSPQVIRHSPQLCTSSTYTASS
jgi:hypothetical protein